MIKNIEENIMKIILITALSMAIQNQIRTNKTLREDEYLSEENLYYISICVGKSCK